MNWNSSGLMSSKCKFGSSKRNKLIGFIKGNLKYIEHIVTSQFSQSKIQKCQSGIFMIFINSSSREEISKAFQLFNKSVKNRLLNDLVEFLKDASNFQLVSSYPLAFFMFCQVCPFHVPPSFD